MRLEGKRAVITGGGRGIGAAIATTFAREGADVALLARTESQLDDVAARVRDCGRTAMTVPCDVSDREAVDSAAQKILGEFNDVDIVVNNAGVSRLGPTQSISVKDWTDTIKVNLYGPFYVTRAFLPGMIKREAGKVVMIASESGKIGYPMLGAYAASKHGLLGFVKSLSNEVKSKSINVNAICPTFVDTPMVPKAMPYERMPAQDVADLALFLSSDAARDIYGEAIDIFGPQQIYALEDFRARQGKKS